jgi:DNA/RNA endonuclease G (NUC1)
MQEMNFTLLQGLTDKAAPAQMAPIQQYQAKTLVVPSYVWKIIVVLPAGTNDLSRITSSTRVIAVWMPNNQTVSSQAWGYYRTTVDYIESMTGYDFLSNLSTTIQAAIESKVDTGATSLVNNFNRIKKPLIA